MTHVTKVSGVKVDPLEIEQSNELQGWKRFLRRFELATIGAVWTIETETDAKATETEFRKGAALLNAIGKEGLGIFDRWDIETNDIRYADITKRYREHFSKKQNVIISRHRFMSMTQHQGEEISKFIDRVSEQSKMCELECIKCAVKDSFVLQIVVKGMLDDHLRELLLITENLDLDILRIKCEQYESAKHTGKAMGNTASGGAGYAEIDAIDLQRNDRTRPQADSEVKCYNCEGRGHISRDCPKERKETRECYKCGTTGHLARDCRNGGVSRGKAEDTRTVKCQYCGKTGHTAQKCFKIEKGHKSVRCLEREGDSDESL